MQTKNVLSTLKTSDKVVVKKSIFLNTLGSVVITIGLLLVPSIAQSAAATAYNIFASIGGNGADGGSPGGSGFAVGGVTAGGNGGDGVGQNGQSVSGGGTGGAGGASLGSASDAGGGGGAASISITNQNNGAIVISKGGDGFDGSEGGGAGSVEASNNTNTADTGTVYGGVAISKGGDTTSNGSGGDAMTATAISNTVNVMIGNVDNIYAGIAISKGGSTGSIGIIGIDNTATASNNNINISGGTVTGNIIGGMVLGNSNSRAENNTITISGATNLANTNILGGAVIDSYTLNTPDIHNISFSFTPTLVANSNTFNGNVLHMDNFSGTGKIRRIGNFERFDFTIGNHVRNGDTILQVGNLQLKNGDTGAGYKFSSIGTISVMPGSSLTVGDTVTLIDFDYVDGGQITNNDDFVQGKQGAFMNYTWQVNQLNIFGAGEITATVTSFSATSTSGVVANTHTGTSTAILGSAAHVLVGNAIPTAQSETRKAGSVKKAMSSGSDASQYNTWTPFTVLQAGHNSFNSGVKTDINSVSFVGGLANNAYHENNQILFGAFIETGIGSYDTSADGIDSDGNVNYVGAGAFSRYEWSGKSNIPYAEVSGRLGSLNTDYESGDIIDPMTGTGVSYNTNSMYYGMHIGAGYIYNLNEQWDLDLSAKYFWTHQESIDKHIAGNNFNFDAIDSHIVRVGANANYETINKETYSFSPYVGFHYEHEFDSRARASVDGLSVPNSASLEGGTGVISLGGTFAYTSGLLLNTKIEGSIGERDGIIGMIEAKYAF